MYDIISISNGKSHNLCIDKQNVLWVFGDNRDGTLGLGPNYEEKNYIYSAMINSYFTNENKIKIAACGPDHNVCINMYGDAYTFGFALMDNVEMVQLVLIRHWCRIALTIIIRN